MSPETTKNDTMAIPMPKNILVAGEPAMAETAVRRGGSAPSHGENRISPTLIQSQLLLTMRGRIVDEFTDSHYEYIIFHILFSSWSEKSAVNKEQGARI